MRFLWIFLLVTLCKIPFAFAFGDQGAFNPRILLTGNARWEGIRTSAPAAWSQELIRRTSAPARLTPTTVRADDPMLLAEPFVIWTGEGEVSALTERERKGLHEFLSLGGVLLVDDAAPENGTFMRSVKSQLSRVLPEGLPIAIGSESVLFRSFYLLKKPAGRVDGPTKVDAILQGGLPRVIFSSSDLLSALAQSPSGTPAISMNVGVTYQREMAIRFAINIAMYVLCSNYKDDQVHAPFLMRRRSSETP